MTGNTNGAALKGRPKSDATRARMRAAFLARPENPAKGRPKSLAWRIALAERIRAGKVGFRTSKRTPYTRPDGRVIRFRSTWEALTAGWFDRKGIPWEYEPRVLVLDQEVYLPDFWRPDLGRFVEVKGDLPPDAKAKLDRFRAAFPIDLWDGPTLRGLGILASGRSNSSPNP